MQLKFKYYIIYIFFDIIIVLLWNILYIYNKMFQMYSLCNKYIKKIIPCNWQSERI